MIEMHWFLFLLMRFVHFFISKFLPKQHGEAHFILQLVKFFQGILCVSKAANRYNNNQMQATKYRGLCKQTIFSWSEVIKSNFFQRVRAMIIENMSFLCIPFLFSSPFFADRKFDSSKSISDERFRALRRYQSCECFINSARSNKEVQLLRNYKNKF